MLYELFVRKRLRRQGFGTAVLAEVEDSTLREGFSTVRLSPEPLDNEISKEDLIEWYRQRGYQIVLSVSEMEKHLLNASR